MSRTLPTVALFSREEFLSTRWRYAPGEHVSLIAPTQSGKTTLAYQLLEHATSPALPGLVLCMKPRDAVVTKWNRKLGYRKVTTWPPLPSPWHPNPAGYTLWPRATADFERDDQRLSEEFRRALRSAYLRWRPAYRKGPWAVFADEVHGLTAELKLTKPLEAIWGRGAGMGCGLWAATQRPAHVPLHMYSSCHHLFLSREPDKRSRDRFAEIGGVDPELVKATVLRLEQYQWLYIRRRDATMCVIDR